MGGTSSALYDRTAEADLGEVERICTDQRAQRSKYHKYIPGLTNNSTIAVSSNKCVCVLFAVN